MNEKFKGITESEYLQLIKAISDITVLIAGADGKIEDSETEWANKITKIRSYNLPKALSEYYKQVGLTFSDDVDQLVSEFRADSEKTSNLIKLRLAHLNDIFSKIENKTLAYELYQSFLSFAKHVARSTGGFLGWGAIGSKEDQVVDLKMIHTVEPPSIDEEIS
ncbi:hypothetical protein [Membranihabitans marinus]|uniref:hypothetical protein n=1 Tax=Membranihabitans marinus TaxID=1227546 RepID=UPI001F25EC76|nr:hypothetical protein [Membranihabitans marinus]